WRPAPASLSRPDSRLHTRDDVERRAAVGTCQMRTDRVEVHRYTAKGDRIRPESAEPARLRRPTGRGGRTKEGIRRRNEVVGARERTCVTRQRVAGTAWQSRHALQHRRKRPLIRAEADEHRAVLGDRPVGRIPAEDLPETILVGARDVRVGGLVLELDAVRLRAPDHALLLW